MKPTPCPNAGCPTRHPKAKPAYLLGVVGDTLITGEPVDKVFSGLSLRHKNRAGQPCPTRFLCGTTAYDNSMISAWRERTCGQHCQEVSSKKDSQQGKGTCKHRKNVHFCHLQGRKPLPPMPPAGGSLRGHRPQKGTQAKEKDTACHMRINLTRRCAQKRKKRPDETDAD